MRSQLGLAPALALAAISLLAAGCPRSGSGLGSESGPGMGAGGTGQGSGAPPGTGSATLYARLGGVDGIRALVDEMVGRWASDPRIQRFFVGTDFRRFKSLLVVQVCELSGGPCRYRGRSMEQVHRGRSIKPAHFEAFLEDASGALRAAQIGFRERHQLLSILRALKQQVVEPPG